MRRMREQKRSFRDRRMRVLTDISSSPPPLHLSVSSPTHPHSPIKIPPLPSLWSDLSPGLTYTSRTDNTPTISEVSLLAKPTECKTDRHYRSWDELLRLRIAEKSRKLPKPPRKKVVNMHIKHTKIEPIDRIVRPRSPLNIVVPLVSERTKGSGKDLK